MNGMRMGCSARVAAGLSPPRDTQNPPGSSMGQFILFVHRTAKNTSARCRVRGMPQRKIDAPGTARVKRMFWGGA